VSILYPEADSFTGIGPKSVSKNSVRFHRTRQGGGFLYNRDAVWGR